MNKNKLNSYNSQYFLAYILIAPAVIYLLCIVGWPLIETFRLSFTNSSIAGEDYVGFENYEKLLSSSKFSKIAIRTFVWTFFSVLLKLIIGMIGAVLLNASLRGRSFFRILVLPPWVVPIAIGALGWMWVYNGHFGILSGIGIRLGILDGPFSFLAYKNSAFIATMVTDIWVGVPFVTLFFLQHPDHLSLHDSPTHTCLPHDAPERRHAHQRVQPRRLRAGSGTPHITRRRPRCVVTFHRSLG